MANTTRTPSTNGPLVPGTFVVYQCNNGLETIAPNTAVCQQDGSWMPDAGGLGRCRQTRKNTIASVKIIVSSSGVARDCKRGGGGISCKSYEKSLAYFTHLATSELFS